MNRTPKHKTARELWFKQRLELERQVKEYKQQKIVWIEEKQQLEASCSEFLEQVSLSEEKIMNLTEDNDELTR